MAEAVAGISNLVLVGSTLNLIKSALNFEVDHKNMLNQIEIAYFKKLIKWNQPQFD
jgi:hypothetical protein